MSKRASASKSKKTKAQPSEPRKWRLPSFSFGQAARWLNRSIFGLIVIGGIAGVALGVGPLQERVGALRSDPLVVRFEWPLISGSKGTWLNEAEQTRLHSIAMAHLTPNPFDRAALVETRDALAATGWFITPPTIQRKPGGVVEIVGMWRKPAAVVRHGRWEHLVSRDGALLPLRYPIGGSGNLPLILNPFTAPPQRTDGGPGVGLPWAGGDIPAAISLFDLLRTSDRYADVAAIDVRRYVRDGLLTIVTTNGGRVVWGAAPGAGAPGEVSERVKLERFERLFADSSWLGESRPPIEIHTSVVLIDESARP